jgi:hypothetical protein
MVFATSTLDRLRQKVLPSGTYGLFLARKTVLVLLEVCGGEFEDFCRASLHLPLGYHSDAREAIPEHDSCSCIVCIPREPKAVFEHGPFEDTRDWLVVPSDGKRQAALVGRDFGFGGEHFHEQVLRKEAGRYCYRFVSGGMRPPGICWCLPVDSMFVFGLLMASIVVRM